MRDKFPAVTAARVEPERVFCHCSEIPNPAVDAVELSDHESLALDCLPTADNFM